MSDNQTIKNRLISFISYLGIGQGRFEKECGLANAYVANIRKSITPEKLQKIAQRYPELNTGWLMTGEGTMLRNQENSSVIAQGDNAVALRNSDIHINSNNGNDVSSEKANIAQYKERIKFLEQLIEEKDKQLQDKERMIQLLLNK